MITFLVTATLPDLRQLMLEKLFTRSSITSDRLLWSYSWIKYYSTYFQKLETREEMAKLLIAMSTGDYEDYRLRTYDDLHLHWTGERDLYIFNISAAERKRYRIPFFWSAYATKGHIAREFIFTKPGALSYYQYFASVFLLGPLDADWTDIYSQWADRRVLAFGRFIFWCFGYVYFLWRRFVIPAVKLAWGILDLCIFIIWMISPFYWIGICFHSIFFRAKTYQLNNVFYTGLWSLVWPTLWLIKFLLYLLTGFQPKPACVHTRSRMKGRSNWYAVAAIEVALLPLKMSWIKWTTPSKNYFKVFYNRWYLYDLLWANDGKLLERIVETGYFFFGRYPWDFAKRIVGALCYYVLFEAKKIRLFLASKLAWAYTFIFNLIFVILKAALYVKLAKNSPRTAFVLLCTNLHIALLKSIIFLDRILFNYVGFALISKTFIKSIKNLTVIVALLKASCRLIVESVKWAWRLLMILLIFVTTLPWHGIGTVFGSLICLVLFPIIALYLVQKKSVKQKVLRKCYQLPEIVVVMASSYARLHNQTFTVLYTKVILRTGLYIRMINGYLENHIFCLVSAAQSISTHKWMIVILTACQALLLKFISALAFGNACVLHLIPINTVRLFLYQILYLIITSLQLLRLVARALIDFFGLTCKKLVSIINIFRRLRLFNFVRGLTYFLGHASNLLGKCTNITWKNVRAHSLSKMELTLKTLIICYIKFILSAGRALVFGVDIFITSLLRMASVFSKQILTLVLPLYPNVGSLKFLGWFLSPDNFLKICKNSVRFVHNIVAFIITLPWVLVKKTFKLMFQHLPLLLVKMSNWNLTAWLFIVKNLVILPGVALKAMLFKGKGTFLLVFGVAVIAYIYMSMGITIPVLFQQGLGLKVFFVDCFSWAIYIGWLGFSIWTVLLLSSLTLLLMSGLVHCLVVVIATIIRAIGGRITYILRSCLNLGSKLLWAGLVPNNSKVRIKSFKVFPAPIKQLGTKVSSFIFDKNSTSKLFVLVLILGAGLGFLNTGVIVYCISWSALQTLILINAGIVVINILIISFVIGLILSKCITLVFNIASTLVYIVDHFFIRYGWFVVGATFKMCSILLSAFSRCLHIVADLCPNPEFFKNQAYQVYLFFRVRAYARIATHKYKRHIVKVFWDTICYKARQVKSINYSPVFVLKYLACQITRGFIKFKIVWLKAVTLLFYIIKICKALEYQHIVYWTITLCAFIKRVSFIKVFLGMCQISSSQLQRQISLLLHKVFWVKLLVRYRAQTLANDLFCIEQLTPITKILILMVHKLQILFGLFKGDAFGPVQVLWYIYSLPSTLYKAMRPIFQIYKKVFSLYFELFFDGLAVLKSYELLIYKQVVDFYYVTNDRGVLICRPFFTLLINHFWLILMVFFTSCGLFGWYVYFILKFVVFYLFWVIASLIQFLLICWVSILQYVSFFAVIVPDKLLPAYKSKYHGYRNLTSDYTRMFLGQGKAWLLQVYYRHHYNVKLFSLKKGLAYKARALNSSQLWFRALKLLLKARHVMWCFTSRNYVRGFEAFYFLHANDAWDFLLRKNFGMFFLFSRVPVFNRIGLLFDGIRVGIFVSALTFHEVRLYFIKLLKSGSSFFYIFLRKPVAPERYNSQSVSWASAYAKNQNGSHISSKLESWGTKKGSSYALFALRINHILKDIFYIGLILMIVVVTSYSCHYIFATLLQPLNYNLPALFLIIVTLCQFICIFIVDALLILSCWSVLWFLWQGASAALKLAILKLKNTYSNSKDLYLYFVTVTQNFKKFWFQVGQAPTNSFHLLIFIISRSKYIQKLINKSDLFINTHVRVAINNHLSSVLSYLQRIFTLNLKTMAKLSDEINTRSLLIWQALYRRWETSTWVVVMLGKANKLIKDIDTWLALKIQQILPVKLKAKVVPSIDTLWPGATKVPKGIKSKIVFSGFWYKDITKQELPNSLHYGWSRTIYRGALWLYAMPIHFIVTGAIESLFWVVMIFVYPLYFWLFYLWAWTWFILNCFRRISLTHKPKGRYWVMADLTNTRYNIRWHYFYKKNSLMLNYKPPKTLTSIRHAVFFKRFCSVFPINVLVKTAEFLTQILITFVRTPIIDPLLNYIGEIYIKPIFFMIATFAVNIGVAYNNRRYRFYRHVSTYFYELKLKWKVLKLSLLWLFLCIVGRFVFKKMVGFLTTAISLSWRAPLLIILVSARYAIQFFCAVVESLTIFLSAGFRQFLLNKKLVSLATIVSNYKPLIWAARGWALILNVFIQAPMLLYWVLTICILKVWYLSLLFSGQYVIQSVLLIISIYSSNTKQLEILRGLYSTLSKRIPSNCQLSTLEFLIRTFDLLVSGQQPTSRLTRPLYEYKTWRQLMLESYNRGLDTVFAQVTQGETSQPLNSYKLKSRSRHQSALETMTHYVLFIEQSIFQVISFGIDRLHRPVTFVIFPFYSIPLRLTRQLQYWIVTIISSMVSVLNRTVRFLIKYVATIVNIIANCWGKLALIVCAVLSRSAGKCNTERARKTGVNFLPYFTIFHHSNRRWGLNKALSKLLSFNTRILGIFFTKCFCVPTFFSDCTHKYFLAAYLYYRDVLSGYIYKAHKKYINAPKIDICNFFNTTYNTWVKRPLVAMAIELWKSLIYTPITIFRVVVLTFLNSLHRLYFPYITVTAFKLQLLDAWKQAVSWKENYSTNVAKVQEYFIWSVNTLTWFLVRLVVLWPLHFVWTSFAFTAKFELFMAYNKAVAWAKGTDYIFVKRPPVSLVGHTILYVLRVWMYIPLILEFYFKLIRRHYYEGYRRYLKRMPASFQAFRRHYSDNRIALSFIQPPEPKELDIIPIGLYKRLETGKTPRKLSKVLHLVRYMTISGWHGTRTSFVFFGMAIKYMIWKTSIAMWNSQLSWAIWYFLEGVLGFIWWSFIRPHAIVLAIILDHISQTFGRREKSELYFLMFIPVQVYIKIPLTAFIHTYQARIDKRVWPGVVAVALGLYFFWKFLLFVHALYVFWPKIALLPASTHILSLSLVIDVYQFINFWLYVAGMSWIYEVVIRPWTLRYFKVYAPALVVAYLMEIHNYVHQDYDIAAFILFMAEHIHYFIQFKLEIRYGWSFFWCTMAIFFWPYFLLQWSLLFPWVISHWEPNIVEYYRKLQIPYAEIVRPVYTIGFSILTAYYNLEFFGTFWFLQLNETDALLNFIAYYGLEDEIWYFDFNTLTLGIEDEWGTHMEYEDYLAGTLPAINYDFSWNFDDMVHDGRDIQFPFWTDNIVFSTEGPGEVNVDPITRTGMRPFIHLFKDARTDNEIFELYRSWMRRIIRKMHWTLQNKYDSTYYTVADEQWAYDAVSKDVVYLFSQNHEMKHTIDEYSPLWEHWMGSPREESSVTWWDIAHGGWEPATFEGYALAREDCLYIPSSIPWNPLLESSLQMSHAFGDRIDNYLIMVERDTYEIPTLPYRQHWYYFWRWGTFEPELFDFINLGVKTANYIRRWFLVFDAVHLSIEMWPEFVRESIIEYYKLRRQVRIRIMWRILSKYEFRRWYIEGLL